jgi:cytidylate kinase
VARDERPPSVLRRLFGSMADAGSPFGVTLGSGDFTVGDEDAFRSTTERILREVGMSGAGVILGRAAAVVLADHTAVLHVRVDGHRSARVARVMGYENLPEDAAAKLVDQTDRAWETYVRYFYKTDPLDPKLYHLIIDSTVIPSEACTELIVAAAQAIPARSTPLRPEGRVS